MNKSEFEAIFTGPQRWQQVGLYFLSRFAITWAGRALFSVVVIIAFALSGCAQLPSVQSCRIAKYERQGDVWSAELRDCRVMQAPLPVGL